MRRFEYTVIEQPLTGVVQTLNMMGDDGWELVIPHGLAGYIFKREVTPEMEEERKQRAKEKQWLAYRTHLAAEHDTQVYIDVDIVGTHRERFPRCEFGLLEERA